MLSKNMSHLAAESSCRLQVQAMKKQTPGDTFRKCKVYPVHSPKGYTKGISYARPWVSPCLQPANQNTRLVISLHCASASKQLARISSLVPSSPFRRNILHK